MKKTAIEWLAEQLSIYGYNVVTVYPELIEQAKEMEKQQQNKFNQQLEMLNKSWKEYCKTNFKSE
jgi:hypothetical protein